MEEKIKKNGARGRRERAKGSRAMQKVVIISVYSMRWRIAIVIKNKRAHA